eukprot:GEMP01050314.1.p2 GENE.GEMP01050314.1~~GEMP01050314.1.p2  ORF type:complete len:125 (+),score=25.02 GEMP01050314.1:58-432(+)
MLTMRSQSQTMFTQNQTMSCTSQGSTTIINVNVRHYVEPIHMSPDDVATWLENLNASVIPNKEYYNHVLADLRDAVLENGWDGVKFEDALRRKRLHALGVKAATNLTYIGRNVEAQWSRDFDQF